MADQRILATENMIGANHPTLTDTLNRLALVSHATDGTHNFITDTAQSTTTGTGAIVTAGGVGIAKNVNVGGTATVGGHVTVEGVTSTGATGSGKLVFDTSPTLVTPVLGTPTSGTLTNCTGLPTGGVTMSATAKVLGRATAGAGVAEELSVTGSGSVVLATSPTLVTPALGVATGTSFNSITALASTASPMDGTAAVGTSTTVARQDHVHASDTSRALLAGSSSQAFATGALTVTGGVSASGIIGTSATGALRMSVGTTAERPVSPEDGMIRMNSTLCRPEYYSSVMAMWIPFSAAGGIPNIGDPFGGGFFAGYISAEGNGIASHMLIVAPKATGETALAWDTTAGGSTTGFTSVIDGPGNSAGLAALGSRYAAATWCEALSIGGYTDWYLPAKNELEVAYHNLKNVSQDNYAPGSFGSNANAVPPLEPVSTAYTATRPGQTNVAAFRVGNSEAFIDSAFWSSTEASAPYAWYQLITTVYPGGQYYNPKTLAYYVRAFRRLLI